ncbi:class I SAM-dependent methyltransferase [Paenibacillus rigui]|uniref:SAM-dependent methyltransferase n=1 Tax=Paenibacillus rigui TaxID=554312 RepID=A0A229UKW4_9BACL|nr:class I SAM-dependent methyltransferase [Paenibacillus rigui]OXM84022.1 SAM-dependent methyltransferase [Paenibacillus rigui]
MDFAELFDPEVWEKAWNEDPHGFASRMRSAGVDPVHSFDHKAEAFDRQAFSEEGIRRRNRIMGWLEEGGVRFEGASVLDVGAASGGFSVPFTERGAKVTAVEPNGPLSTLLEANNANRVQGRIHLVREPFERIDYASRGWEKAFDLVFASMCPAASNWEGIEKLIGCAAQFCYISTSAGPREHSLTTEVLPLLRKEPTETERSDMGYLMQLLFVKGYAYRSIVTREYTEREMSHEAAVAETMQELRHRYLSAEERSQDIVNDYVRRTYPNGKVAVRSGGRFGKVLIQLADERMK